MAIDLNGLSSVNAGTRSKVDNTANNGRGKSVDKQPAASAQPQPETVKLSPEAQTLSKLEERVAQLPEVDEAKVASIKQAVDSGTYAVDPESIAAKLTSLEGRLFG